MVLRMSRPWKHPKTGIYWLRKPVPPDLSATIGRIEIRKTLRTRDPYEAKERLARELLELESQWSKLRGGPRRITEREAHHLAKQDIEDWWFKQFHENPSEQLWWHTELHSIMWKGVWPRKAPPNTALLINIQRESMYRRCVDDANSMLVRYGFETDPWSVTITAEAIGNAYQRAGLKIEQVRLGNLVIPDRPVGLILSPEYYQRSAIGTYLTQPEPASNQSSVHSLSALLKTGGKKAKLPAANPVPTKAIDILSIFSLNFSVTTMQVK